MFVLFIMNNADIISKQKILIKILVHEHKYLYTYIKSMQESARICSEYCNFLKN